MGGKGNLQGLVGLLPSYGDAIFVDADENGIKLIPKPRAQAEPAGAAPKEQ